MVKRALVLGSALSVWDEVEAVLEMAEFHGVVAAKGAGLHWKGKLDSWVSLHPDRFAKDVSLRLKFGYPAAHEIVGHEGCGVKGLTATRPYKFAGQKHSGSSGLFALKRAIELGFDRIVLCGIPLLREAGKLDSGRSWAGATSFYQGFEEAMPHIRHVARSMSGRTKTLLGYPTAEWLNGDG
jgi:hypothetical protein